jgi:hypothetical protein
MGNLSPQPKSPIVGDQTLQIEINTDKGIAESAFQTHGLRIEGLSGLPWTITTDSGKIDPRSGAITIEPSAGIPTQHLLIKGSLDALDWTLKYDLTGIGRITKSLTITPKKDLLVKTVSLWNGRSETAPIVSSTTLQDIAAFYRQKNEGLFVSLDFPYSKIMREGTTTAVTYPPYQKLKAGQTYTFHTLTIGATNLTNKIRYGFDEGEVDAMDTYVQERFTPRFQRPMFVSACINNRYTQLQGDAVFYTMKDHPTFSFNPDILKREMELLPKLGMEYYQLWTGPFDSVSDDPDPSFVKQTVREGRKLGLRLGDYSGTQEMFCGHYNEHRNSLENHPEWGISRADVCFGNPKFVKFYKDLVVKNAKRYGFEIHCLDFLNIHPCDATNHGHPTGQDSVYEQIKGLVEILEGLNAVSPEMMTWSNSGNWAELLPKIAWANPNLYLTDPFIADPWQGLNMTRLLDDARRQQMVSLHYTRFVPYRNFTNCQYFFSQNSVVPDIRNYQYGALSSIAVTPNLCLAEVRPWMDHLPEQSQKEVIDFYKKWTDFLKSNYGLWTKTYHVGGNPGGKEVEVYSHAKGDHGFVFLVNPYYWNQVVSVLPDRSLGFEGLGQYEVTERYPIERRRIVGLNAIGPAGASFNVEVPAQTVIVIEIQPAPKTITEPRLYGVPGTVEQTKDGYVVKTSGQQGVTERCIVMLPKTENSVTEVSVRDVPKQPLRLWSPTPISEVVINGSSVAFDVMFRRDKAPSDLRQWRVQKGTLADGLAAGWSAEIPNATEMQLPMFTNYVFSLTPDTKPGPIHVGPLAEFCGAYVENAFSEVQETWIDLKTGLKSKLLVGPLMGNKTSPSYHVQNPIEADDAKTWWVSTSFHLPFNYMIGAEPPFDDHQLLVFPFTDPSRVVQIKAWINGVPLDVNRYLYPRNRALSCFYADLVGSAALGGKTNKLVVYFEVN